MNGKIPGYCLPQTRNIRGRLWHRYTATVNRSWWGSYNFRSDDYNLTTENTSCSSFLISSNSLTSFSLLLFWRYWKKQILITGSCCSWIYLQVSIIITPCELDSLPWGSSWSWSHDSYIINYLCNLCLSPLTLWTRISLIARCTR